MAPSFTVWLLYISLFFPGNCWGQTTETLTTENPQKGGSLQQDGDKEQQQPVKRYKFKYLSEPIFVTKYYNHYISSTDENTIVSRGSAIDSKAHNLTYESNVTPINISSESANSSNAGAKLFSSAPRNEAGSNAETEIVISEPLETCRNCIIHSIEGNVMGIREIVRSDPFDPDVKCKVSLAEIQQIITLIEDIITGTVNTGGLLHVTAAAKNKCEEAMHNIIVLSGELSQLLKRMSSAGKISPEEYAAMKNIYEHKIDDLKKQMDFVKRQADQTTMEEMDKAQKAIDEVRKNYNDAMDRLEKEMAKVQLLSIQLTAAYIREGKIKAARQKYDEIEHRAEKLEDIIKIAYGVDKIDRILLFSNLLSSDAEKAYVCQHMVANMLIQKDLESPLVLVVDRYAKVLLTKGVLPDTLNTAIKNLQPGVQNVINSFGSRIVLKREEEVLKFAEERPGIFDKFIPQLVHAAFMVAKSTAVAVTGIDGLEEGCKKILDFAENLYSDSVQRSNVDKVLYKEMKDVDEFRLSALLRIGYRDFKLHQGSGDIFKELPKEIQHMLTGRTDGSVVSLPFSFWRGYYDDQQYVVISSEDDYRFGTEDGITFYIRNRRRYFLVAASDDDSRRFPNERRVRPGQRYVNDPYTQWEIRDANWKEHKYYIYNKHFDEYMNVCGKANSRFPEDYGEWWHQVIGPPAVCTWKDKKKGPDSMWEIKARN